MILSANNDTAWLLLLAFYVTRVVLETYSLFSSYSRIWVSSFVEICNTYVLTDTRRYSILILSIYTQCNPLNDLLDFFEFWIQTFHEDNFLVNLIYKVYTHDFMLISSKQIHDSWLLSSVGRFQWRGQNNEVTIIDATVWKKISN